MKFLLWIALLVAYVGGITASGADSPFAVSLVIPRSEMHNERRLIFPNSGTPWDTQQSFFVILRNRSLETQRIWKEGVSWGDGRVSFEITDAAGKTWEAVSRGMRAYTANRPTYWMLEPEESIVYTIVYSDSKSWPDLPKPEPGSKITVSMRAIFQIPSTPESGKHGVWTGRSVGESREVTFYQPKSDRRMRSPNNRVQRNGGLRAAPIPTN